MKQGNTARNAKIQFLKMFFWIPFIAVIAIIFPISRSRRPNSRYRGTAMTANYPCVCSLPATPLIIIHSLYCTSKVSKVLGSGVQSMNTYWRRTHKLLIGHLLNHTTRTLCFITIILYVINIRTLYSKHTWLQCCCIKTLAPMIHGIILKRLKLSRSKDWC